MTFPHIDEIYKYIADSDTPQSKRDIVKAFGIKGDDRKILKQYLKTLEEDGRIIRGEKSAYSVPNSLPSVTMIRVTKIDDEGDVFAEPLEWDEAVQGDKPRIELPCTTTLKVGDRALARLKKFTDKLYEGKIIRAVDKQRASVLGQIKKTAKGYLLQPNMILMWRKPI